jgi:hypothetical protein
VLLAFADKDGPGVPLIVDLQVEFYLAFLAVELQAESVGKLARFELKCQLVAGVVEAPGILRAFFLPIILQPDRQDGFDLCLLHTDRAVKIATDLGRRTQVPAFVPGVVPNVVPRGLIDDLSFGLSDRIKHDRLRLRFGRFLCLWFLASARRQGKQNNQQYHRSFTSTHGYPLQSQPSVDWHGPIDSILNQPGKQ